MQYKMKLPCLLSSLFFYFFFISFGMFRLGRWVVVWCIWLLRTFDTWRHGTSSGSSTHRHITEWYPSISDDGYQSKVISRHYWILSRVFYLSTELRHQIVIQSIDSASCFSIHHQSKPSSMNIQHYLKHWKMAPMRRLKPLIGCWILQ